MKTFGLRKLNLKELIFLALIIALRIVLDKLSIGTNYLQVGFGFLGSVLLGFFFGPFWGFIGGAVGDLAKMALGSPYGFFIGWTISAALGPMIYGFFFYKKPVQIWRIIAAVIVVTIFVDLILNTWWVYLQYGLSTKVFWLRVANQAIAPWIRMVIIYIVLRAIPAVQVKRLLTNK